jgi:hypothetical protein
VRILIDECVDERVRLLFPGHDCQTARFAKLAGLKNGRLLDAAETPVSTFSLLSTAIFRISRTLAAGTSRSSFCAGQPIACAIWGH